MTKLSWKQWLGFNLYKKLWSLIGKRPWTFITRDARQKYPLPWQLCLSGVMITVGHFFWGIPLLIFSGGVVLGILLGHFWWGTKHILGQQGK